MADDAGQTDRAKIDERHAEATIEDAEDGRARGDPQVAPQRELHAARDRGALDGGDHWLSELKTRRAHRSELAVRLETTRLAIGDRLKIGPGAEGVSRAGEHRHIGGRIGVEAFEGVKQGARGLKVNGVAPLGRSIVTTVTRPSARVKTVDRSPVASCMASSSIEKASAVSAA